MQRLFLSSAVCAFAAAVALATPAAAETVTVQLRGFEEVPVNVSPATGSLRLFINDRATFGGLSWSLPAGKSGTLFVTAEE